MDLAKIAVVSADFGKYERMLAAIGDICHVRFEQVRGEDLHQHRGIVLIDGSREEVVRWAGRGVRGLAYIRGALRTGSTPDRPVVLTDSPEVTKHFRGASLAHSALQVVDPGQEMPGDVTLARQGSDRVWIRASEGGTSVDLVAVRPPIVTSSEYLFAHFCQERWVALLPLLQFARELSGWENPPVRACFMFDDPNLHWPTYGYVNYREMAEHAASHHYHASFATVPVDGWYVHQPTARTFRDNPGQLSLLVHGNDHTHYELHRQTSRNAQTALAAQALRRIARLERQAGIPIARVMAAPHGACSEGMAHALVRTGFEAASISRGSLMARNAQIGWPVSVGLRPCEFLGGLPILPRFNVQSDPRWRVRFAAFLGQPVIPVGHHDDLNDGLTLLAETAKVVNAVDTIEWTDPSTIARTNYQSRRAGAVLHIRMYSRRVRVHIPSGVSQLRIERPWRQDGEDAEPLAVECNGASEVHARYDGEGVAVAEGQEVVVSGNHHEAVDPASVPPLRTTVRAFVRRQLCEGRDRIRPTLDRLRSATS
jgi:hypothetical protein